MVQVVAAVAATMAVAAETAVTDIQMDNLVQVVHHTATQLTVQTLHIHQAVIQLLLKHHMHNMEVVRRQVVQEEMPLAHLAQQVDMVE
jgi:predicted nicotinamide N-methyase